MNVFVVSRAWENSKTFVYDNKETSRRHCRRCHRATWKIESRSRKGGCRLFFMSSAAFQVAVVTLLECFQRDRGGKRARDEKMRRRVYKAKRQRVHMTDSDLHVSSLENTFDQELHNNDVRACDVYNLKCPVHKEFT